MSKGSLFQSHSTYFKQPNGKTKDNKMSNLKTESVSISIGDENVPLPDSINNPNEKVAVDYHAMQSDYQSMDVDYKIYPRDVIKAYLESYFTGELIDLPDIRRGKNANKVYKVLIEDYFKLGNFSNFHRRRTNTKHFMSNLESKPKEELLDIMDICDSVLHDPNDALNKILRGKHKDQFTYIYLKAKSVVETSSDDIMDPNAGDVNGNVGNYGGDDFDSCYEAQFNVDFDDKISQLRSLIKGCHKGPYVDYHIMNLITSIQNFDDLYSLFQLLQSDSQFFYLANERGAGANYFEAVRKKAMAFSAQGRIDAPEINKQLKQIMQQSKQNPYDVPDANGGVRLYRRRRNNGGDQQPQFHHGKGPRQSHSKYSNNRKSDSSVDDDFYNRIPGF